MPEEVDVIVVEFHGIQDVAHLIDGLLEAADHWDTDRPLLARRYRALADRVGDKLERARHAEAIAG